MFCSTSGFPSSSLWTLTCRSSPCLEPTQDENAVFGTAIVGMTNERSGIETGCGALRLLFQRRFCRTLHWCAPLDEGFSELAIPTPKQSQQISKAFGSCLFTLRTNSSMGLFITVSKIAQLSTPAQKWLETIDVSCNTCRIHWSIMKYSSEGSCYNCEGSSTAISLDIELLLWVRKLSWYLRCT